MGQTIVRGEAIDRQRILIGPVVILEEIDLVGEIPVGTLGTGLEAGILAGIVRVEMLEILAGIVRVEILLEEGLAGILVAPYREGLDLRGMRGPVGRQPILAGLRRITRDRRGIPMQGSRREAEEATIGHRSSSDHNSGHRSKLSRDHRPVRGRVDLPETTMAEQRGRRAIVAEPVLVVVVHVREGNADETSQS